MPANCLLRLIKPFFFILSSCAMTSSLFGQAVGGDAVLQFKTVSNSNGPVIGYTPASGVQLLKIDGRNFKDLNKNGKLDRYEDWRLTAAERAKDLAGKMTVEQIAGLMLYSGHQAVPANPRGLGAATYNGKPFAESGAKPADLTDQQKKFLKEDNLRHVLVTRLQSPLVAAEWNNNVQAFVEASGSVSLPITARIRGTTLLQARNIMQVLVERYQCGPKRSASRLPSTPPSCNSLGP